MLVEDGLMGCDEGSAVIWFWMWCSVQLGMVIGQIQVVKVLIGLVLQYNKLSYRDGHRVCHYQKRHKGILL